MMKARIVVKPKTLKVVEQVPEATLAIEITQETEVVQATEVAKAPVNTHAKINPADWLAYEYLTCQRHTANYHHITYHWSAIPEYILKASGFIHDYNTLRLKRKFYQTEFQSTAVYYNPVREYGLDAIAIETIDNQAIYHGIQSKMWKKTLCGGDLGTFYQAMFRLMQKDPRAHGYLYHSGPLQIDVRDDFKVFKSLTAINLPFNPKPQMNRPILKETGFILYDFQQEAVTTLNQKMSGIKHLTLPSGCGKTVIFCNHLRHRKYKNVFIMSPLRIHTKQNLERAQPFLPEYKDLLLDADGTCDFKSVAKILHTNSLISTTYKSAEEVLIQLFKTEEDAEEAEGLELEGMGEAEGAEGAEVLETESEGAEEEAEADLETEFDETAKVYQSLYDLSDSILIVDEAHNLINNKPLIKLVRSFPNVLLVTATPPTQMKSIIGGDTIYQYTMKKAIDAKQICDYRLYFPLIVRNSETNQSGVLVDIPKELMTLDNNLCKQCLFLINGLLRTGSRHCIVYLNSIADCVQFQKVFQTIMKDYHGLAYWIDKITVDTNKTARTDILKEFEAYGNGMIKIIMAIHILDEGVDIPKCDSVFITQLGEWTSDIRTVQRMCRANRLDSQHPNKIASCFLWADDLNKSVNALRILRDNDPEFRHKIRMISSDYDRNESVEVETQEQTINLDFQNYINIECLSQKEMWQHKCNLLFEHAEKFQRAPTQKEIYKDIKLGIWLSEQKRKIKTTNDEMYKLLSVNANIKKNLDIYLDTIIDAIPNEEKHVLFNLFVEEFKRTPKYNEKYKNCNVGQWFATQKHKISSDQSKNYIELAINPIIKENLDSLLTKKETLVTQENKTQLFFKFVTEMQRVPKGIEKYNGDSVGNWYGTQKKKINSNLDETYKILSTNKIVKADLDQYLINKEKNKSKTRSTQADTIKTLFDFIEKFKRIPKTKEIYNEKALGASLSDMKVSITTKTDQLYKILASNKLLKIHLDEYLDYKSKNLTQDKLTQSFLEFVEKNQRIPITREKIDGFSLGSWYSRKKKLIKTTDDPLYIELAVNQFIKDDIDYNLVTKTHNLLSDEDKIKILFDYVKTYNKSPLSGVKHNNVLIGSWYNHIKTNKISSTDDNMYKLLSANSIIKKNMDDYFFNREDAKNKPIITQDDKLDLLFQFVNEFARVPSTREMYQDVQLGRWLDEKKARINSTNDENYKKLSQTLIVKKYLDDHLTYKKKIKIV